MHLPDGILPVTVAVAGYAAAGGITYGTLQKIKKQYQNPRELIPRTSLLTAVFFAASLLHFPIPPASVHLTLAGLVGVMLGWFSFPAILVGLFFQAVMFQHGGLTTLGINACLMGLPALLSYGVFQMCRLFGKDKKVTNALAGFFSGFLAVALAALFASLLLINTIPEHLNVVSERAAVTALSLAHFPIAVLEGVFTAMIVLYLLRVKPELLVLNK